MGEQPWRKQKMFCFRDVNSTSSKYVALGRKRGNNRKTFKVSVSLVFPEWFLDSTPTQHMLKTQNPRLESKKCFRNFRKTLFCVLDTILLPQQCFLVSACLKSIPIWQKMLAKFLQDFSCLFPELVIFYWLVCAESSKNLWIRRCTKLVCKKYVFKQIAFSRLLGYGYWICLLWTSRTCTWSVQNSLYLTDMFQNTTSTLTVAVVT